MAILAAVVMVALLAAQGSGAARLQTGELAAINLVRRSVVVKTGDKPPRDMEFTIDSATSIVSRGRTLRLEELRPGDPIKVLYRDEGQRRFAVVVKAGPSRHSVPAPSPSPSPRP